MKFNVAWWYIVLCTMRFQRRKYFTRFIVLLAFLQSVAPAVASIADAWLEGHAARVVQVGEQGSANYLAAHPDDCALCAASAAVTGYADPKAEPPAVQLVRQAPVAFSEVRRPAIARHVASQRAPPVLS